MRTVHETEALRPSDPVPRNYSSAHFKPQRLKLVMNSRRPNLDAGDLAGGGADTLDEEGGALDIPSDLENEGATSNLAEHSPQHHHRPRKSAATSAKAPTASTSSTITKPSFLAELDDPSLTPEQEFKLLRRQLTMAEDENDMLQAECAELTKAYRQEWMAKELVLSNLMEAELAVAHRSNAGEVTEGHLSDLPLVPLPMTGDTVVWYRRTHQDGDDDDGDDEDDDTPAGYTARDLPTP